MDTVILGLCVCKIFLDMPIFLMILSDMELNIEKIEQEMDRLGITKADLAREWNVTRQAIDYYFKQKPIKAAERFGKFFSISPKDLIV